MTVAAPAASGNRVRRWVILSYGLGVDSTAVLLRRILDPSSRDFDLRDLVVLIAQTGNEWPQTARLVERFVFPLLRRYGIRTVQVARAGQSDAAGIVVLDDTRQPYVCHLGGAYTLGEKMIAVGTVPQVGGRRDCSIRFKGWVLDRWVLDTVGGLPYEHAVGFELGELSRMRIDLKASKMPGRTPFYPLIDWGWHREHAQAYIREHLDVEWIKSACTFCPFALTSEGGRERTIPRYIADPDQAMLPLLMEHLAVALNQRQGLAGGEQLVSMLAAEPGARPLLRQFARHLADQEWALYEVKRAFRKKEGEAMKMANAARSLVRVGVGGRAEMLDELAARARTLGKPVKRDGAHRRVWAHRKNMYFPCVEEMLTVAPALAPDKIGPGFDDAWEKGLRGPRQLQLVA
ncbi:hypothetical protein AB0F88_17100 [Streptosporangium sp. NPDC023963]|uniref:hypothetical protein n=1 Tax=Streptosporangium sp. NPDC023963 TaxID=3155608 RepID=UPI003438F24F